MIGRLSDGTLIQNLLIQTGTYAQFNVYHPQKLPVSSTLIQRVISPCETGFPGQENPKLDSATLKTKNNFVTPQRQTNFFLFDRILPMSPQPQSTGEILPLTTRRSSIVPGAPYAISLQLQRSPNSYNPQALDPFFFARHPLSRTFLLVGHNSKIKISAGNVEPQENYMQIRYK